MEKISNKFIIPKGTILKSYISKEESDLYLKPNMNFKKNQYYSLFIGDTESFLSLYKKYYKTFEQKCNNNNLNLYLVKEDLVLLKWPDDLYSSECRITDNEKNFIYLLFNLIYKKYIEEQNENKNRYLCYLKSIIDLFINPCELDNYEDLKKKVDLIKKEKTQKCNANPDYNLDKLFDEFQLNGWLRFNQQNLLDYPDMNNNVDEIMLTKTYLNESPKKIELILSIDCSKFVNKETEVEVKDDLQNILDDLDNHDFIYYNYDKNAITELLEQPQKNPFPVNKESYTVESEKLKQLNYNYIYKQKYLKYKQKYLKLKNKLN